MKPDIVYYTSLYSIIEMFGTFANNGRQSRQKPRLGKWTNYLIPRWLRPSAQNAHGHISSINQSKIFAVLVMLTMNISNRFVNLKLSKGVENYLKITFSRNILIFCVAWMGSRDIYLAILATIIFSIFADIFFNEESKYCLLPETFTNYYLNTDTSKNTPSTIIIAPQTNGNTDKPAVTDDKKS